MEPTSTYYIDLIARYFYGEATPDEIHELEAWVKVDPANAAIFSEFQKTWKAVEDTRIAASVNLDDEWNKLKTKTKSANFEFPGSLPKTSFLPWFVRVAAIFLILAVPSFFLYRYLQAPAENQLTAFAGMVGQTLPDGTIVTLNTGAKLTYPSRFDGPLRKVSLEGEAWFEVAHNRSKPFIIASENVRIRVVGTAFSVNTKAWNNTQEVILSSGVVRVYFQNKPEATTLLFPGEKAQLSQDHYTIIKSANEDVNFLAWKTRHLIFNNTSLTEVVALLTKVYHSNIHLSDDKLGDCRITATFDKQSLESILNVLKATLNLQVRNTGAGFELSGPGCDKGR